MCMETIIIIIGISRYSNVLETVDVDHGRLSACVTDDIDQSPKRDMKPIPMFWPEAITVLYMLLRAVLVGEKWAKDEFYHFRFRCCETIL